MAGLVMAGVVGVGLGTGVLDVPRGRTAPARASSAPALRSPRNGLIAFVAAGGGIGVITENGRGLRLLTRDRRDAHPAWSPDGTRLLFARGKDLQLIRADGSSKRRLTRGSADATWSPDGQRIAFIRDGDLFVIGADGTGLRRLTRTPTAEYATAWSPRGGQIAYFRGDSLLLVRPNGTRQRIIYSDEEVGIDGPATWSPAGDAIAFEEGLYGDGHWIFAIRPETRNPFLFVSDAGSTSDHVIDDAYPRWSPDGKRIAFQRTIWLCGECDVAGVWTIERNGTHALEVTDEGTHPLWSPDATKLLIHVGDGLSLFTPTGLRLVTLPIRGCEDRPCSPTWQPLPGE